MTHYPTLAAMKRIFSFVVLAPVCFLGILAIDSFDSQELFIVSKESKTITGDPVFNKIRYFQFRDKDVWMMNQSHHGPFASERSWDRLAIVVDKRQSPKVARFYQLEPGPLRWKEDLVELPFKVSCFICHNNGPRAIRPNGNSRIDFSGFRDRLKIYYWNLRIKSYGRVLASPIHDERDQSQDPPFRFRSAYENEALQVASCTACHRESGLFARGLLRRQQMPTIKFMVESGQMPPFGFWLSEKERLDLDKFLAGF